MKNHFLNHFNINSNHSTFVIDTLPTVEYLRSINFSDVNSEPPQTEELIKTIKSLKNGKSANDFPAAFMKYAIDSHAFFSEIENLFNLLWQTNDIPKTWSHTKLVALWKGPNKGNQNDPTTYRALQIGSTLCKILVNIILNRLRSWYESQLMDKQQGFRSGRGTTDAIYILKRTHEITDRMKKPVYLLFIDLTAAFDHVDRDLMFRTIRYRLPTGASTKLFDLLEALYSHTTTAMAQTPDDEFEIRNGVRQGGPESPVLFNLYIDYVMRVFINLCNIKGINFLQLKHKIPQSASQSNKATLGVQQIDWIGYADDITLAFDDVKNLRLGAYQLHTVLHKYKLEINMKKTKTMILNQQYTDDAYPENIITINKYKIENVKTFEYLGCCIKYDEPATGNMELQIRIDTAHDKFYALGKHLLNHKIALSTRVKVFNSLVRSRLSYASQAWVLTQRQLNHINSIYINMLRKMIKGGFRRKEGTYHYQLTNADILQKCKTKSMQQYTARLQQTFVAHIIRGGNDRTTKRLLFNNDVNKKQGPSITLYKSVIRNQSTTTDEFNKNSLLRLY